MLFYGVYDRGNHEYTGQYFISEKKAQEVATACNQEESDFDWECDDFVVKELMLIE